MKKIYRKLTRDQIDRGVVFSSTLSESTLEQANDTVHEVLFDEEEREETVARLKDDRFFNASQYKFNIIRQ